MTVFVDDMEAPFTPKHRSGVRYTLCHMITDDPTFNELHAMADEIGVARRWFQGDHYDIAKTKRDLAIAAGAVEITWREAGRMMTEQRRRRAALVQQ